MMGLVFCLANLGRAIILPTSVNVTPLGSGEAPVAPLDSSGAGGGALIMPSNLDRAKVVLNGYSFPGATIYIMKNAKSFADSKADANGQFTIEIADLEPGITSFSLVSRIAGLPDALPYSFTVTLTRNFITAVDNILLPPIIMLSNNQFRKDQAIDISGRAIAGSKVWLEFNNDIVREASVDKSGNWFLQISANNFAKGSYGVSSYVVDKNGGTSVKSREVYFSVGTSADADRQCVNDADINSDGHVNLMDFSILFYNLGRFVNKKADLNCDNKIDYADFSILLYYWRG